MNALRVAYFVNYYPKVSHTFIRREILALERQGVAVQRLALRGWDSELVDPEDVCERERTQYVLKGTLAVLLWSALVMLFTRPLRFFAGVRLALRMSIKASQPWPYHLIYLAEACRIVPWLEKFGANHIHAHFGTNSAEVVMLASELSDVPYSFTIHGCDEFDRPEFIGLAEKIRRSAFVVAISSFGRAQLYRWVERVYWTKVSVVHCALDLAFYKLPLEPVPERPRLVCVGRLCKEKGLPLLMDAAALLAQRKLDFEIVLAGDGEMRTEIESLIKSLNLCERVSITGWISNEQIRAELLASRALVLPSFAEGLPVVIMEAMAMGRPVLASYLAGIPELVRPGENGWLFPAGSVEELASAMEKCLTLPVAELTQMGESARVRVLERHNIDREAGKLIVLFEEAAAKRSIPAVSLG